jgi:hypothetical protein
VSGRSWGGRWGVTYREWQPKARSGEGPILNRLAGRQYRISESRAGEWTVKWLDDNGRVVAWFGGDIRLVFVALQHLADRTDREFGIVVDRIWRSEPQLSAELKALSDTSESAPNSDAKGAGRSRPKRK